MRNKVFSEYNRVKYLMRVKHWRGRSVHSPFLYSVVREGFMRNDSLPINETLFTQLKERGFSQVQALRVCRLYAHLGYESYTFDAANYTDEQLIVLGENITPKDIALIAQKNCKNHRTICVVMHGIYKTKERHHMWNLLSVVTGGVAVDLYHNGYLFIDCHLNRQKFKMRF